ncbi:acyl carrier protein [Myxacorys almedinensis]|uniref:Acyl carrier protein n=1 Tax=Myxacorys almedinensis A TaxID=2690445 RepID=A0A8J8CK12_9CYAN|nr:acyl carrier protein [Myxacorys almedinensis]NDJ19428.1 acyl carrier protein [Myxacorys almedinensis A]
MQIKNSQVELPSGLDYIKADISDQGLVTATEIQTWIVNYLAELLEIDPDEINVTIPFDRYGLDSATAVGMTGDLEEWLGKTIDPTLLYDYPTVKAFSHHLAEEFRSKA